MKGLGIDIVEIKRIQMLYEAYPKRLVTKLLTLNEINELAHTHYKSRFLAKRFAAKEALVKALGTGFTSTIRLNTIAIAHEDKGKPYFELNDNLTKVLQSHGISKIHLSISDSEAYAVAVAVAE